MLGTRGDEDSIAWTELDAVKADRTRDHVQVLGAVVAMGAESRAGTSRPGVWAQAKPSEKGHGVALSRYTLHTHWRRNLA